MRAKEYAGARSEFEARITTPAVDYVGGFESLIFRTNRDRPTNEDAIRGIR